MGIFNWKHILLWCLVLSGVVVLMLLLHASIVLIASRNGLDYMKEMVGFSNEFNRIVLTTIATIVTTLITTNKEAIKSLADKWIFKK